VIHTRRRRYKRPRPSAGAVLLFGVVMILAGFSRLAWSESGTGPETLPETAQGSVTSVQDDGSLRISTLNAEVRLAGVLLSSGTQALKPLVDGRVVTVRSSRVDRRGRLVAHVVRDDGVWVQGALVEQGLARVTAHDGDDVTAALLAREVMARHNKVGLWADPAFAVRAATDVVRLDQDKGSFQIVAGYVLGAARRDDVIFLNFGRDFRQDFTVTIPRDSWPHFAAAGVKPLSLNGRFVQIRGWITQSNGPAMEMTHPAAVEVLEEVGEGAAFESDRRRRL